MVNQMSFYDFTGETVTPIPQVNAEGYIPAEQLVPVRWEAWKYHENNKTFMNGKPYILDAVVAVLPGNRLYIKEWMLYPFMYELESAKEVDKMYEQARERIVWRMTRNSRNCQTWQVNELPELSDMWKYSDTEYSCKEYAETRLYGHQSVSK